MTKSRPYRSDRRAKQAAETRQEILLTARRLFADKGYAATQLSDIASEAGVSVQTLYASIGSKAKIALALVDFINEQSDIPENDAIQQAMTTPVEMIRANVHLVRVLYERAGEFILSMAAAAELEPELRAPIEAGRRYHREGMHRQAERLMEMGALREGLTVDDAAAILTALALPEVIVHLHRGETWSYDQIEGWLADSYIRLLLSPDVW